MSELHPRLAAALADRYRIERRIGEGGMATVYLAEDLKHDRQVALKVLRPELTAMLGPERFVQEIRTTANLHHPNILPLFDSGEADGFLYYVMPFVTGETLREKLDRETQLPVDEAISIATEAADALDYAHRQGVIHRDIKPENILLHDGRPLVADFGIALAVSAAGGARMTQTGLSLGTPHYMSPEQATAERDPDGRSDVYSLGATLYELLVGRPPFDAATGQAVIAKILTEPATPVRSGRATVPAHVDAAVQTALSKLPADRFTSAAAFRDALHDPSFTTTGGVEAPAPGSSWRRASAILAATTLVLAGMVLRDALAPDPSPGVSRQRIVLGSPEVSPSYVHFGTAIAPDGSAIAFLDSIGLSPSGVTNEPRLYVKERASAEPVPLSGAGPAEAPFFSPDGDWIGFVTPSGELRKVRRTGGPAEILADSAGPGGGAWLEDGTILFSSEDSRAVFSVPDTGGATKTVLAPGALGDGLALAMSPLPRSRGVLITSTHPSTGHGQLWVLDHESGEGRLLLERAGSGYYLGTGHLAWVSPTGDVLAAPFDVESLTLSGEGRVVLSNVASVFNVADFKATRAGTVLYASGAPLSPTQELAASGYAGELVWVDRDGEPTPVDPTMSGDLRVIPEGGLQLSPGDERIALNLFEGEGRSDIQVKELPEGPLVKLTFEGANFRPIWVPDGSAVLFVSDRDGEGYSLWSAPADGSRAPERVYDPAEIVWEVVPLSDSDSLLVRVDENRGDVRIVEPGRDDPPVELLASPFDELAPALSPDGDWLAYVSDERGRPEIYVRPFPDAASARYPISRNGGTEPLWAHGGDELFYWNGAGQMVAAAVSRDPEFRVLERTVLFDGGRYARSTSHRYYDVTEDGQRFIMFRITGRRGPANPADMAQLRNNVILVENFLEEVRTRLGG